jgi:hypothetical protein
MNRTLHAAIAAVFLAAGAGCDEQTGPDPSSGGSGGTGGGPTSTTGSEGPTSGTDTGASAGSAPASTGSGGTPCDPLADATDTTPTPGECQGNVAVTCGQDGFLVHERCGEGTECREYVLDEQMFNADPNNPAWVPHRTVDWAGCLPIGAESCERIWTGSYYVWADPPHCDGASKLVCLGFPAPDLFGNAPQLQYGGPEGYLSVVDCPAGERCAGSSSIDQLTCIPESTPACDGTEPNCGAGGIEHCYGTWESLPGYKWVEPCTAGMVCYEGTSGPFCREPGEVPCDDATFVEACSADFGSIVDCYQGWTIHQSCSMCLDDGQTVPCRCDALTDLVGWSWIGGNLSCSEAVGLACVPQAAADCDPLVDQDQCVGDVAHRCVGHWDVIDCAAHGLVCDVGAGHAGCRAPNAQPCEPWNYQETCDGTEIVACCACEFYPWFAPAPPAPCVTGFEIRLDCADWGSVYACEPPQFPEPWGECVYMP